MSLRPGDAIEQFVIVSPLGQGGMGQVYVARDTRLQRNVALKIMQPELEAGESGQAKSGGAARLLREAQAAAGLEHPNVVTIYEVGEVHVEGEAAGRPFIAMELVKGKPLRAFVMDESVTTATRLRWLVDVARALAAAHAAGLVHRDMKPENVMVRDDGAIKVLDFGLAKRAASTAMSSTTSTEAQVLPSLTAKGVAVGTPYYMAPEQMRREPLDGRADQFSWAVVAYELLARTPPWGRDVDALELVSKLLTQTPAPLTDLRSDVPARVSSAVARAMSKSRSDRFASMDELIAAIEGSEIDSSASPRVSVRPPSKAGEAYEAVVPHGATVEVTSAPRAATPAPRRSRWPLVAGALTALLAASTIGTFVAWKRGGPTASSAPPIAARRECAKSRECTAKLGTTAVCSALGTCAKLASEDCEVRADPMALESDDTIWFGTLYPKDDPVLQVDFSAVDLARQDFAQMMSGFAKTGSDARVRPFGLVACDNGANVMRAAKHLVEDVHVPAVIGFRSSAEVVDVGSALLVPNDVVGIIPLSTSPLVTSLPTRPGQPRLIWRTTYSSAQTARALARVVPEVFEPKVRSGAGAIAASAPMRVAYIRDKSRGGATFDALVFDALRYNGKSALENGGDFRRFVIDGSDAAQTAADSKAAVVALAKFAPNVILFAATIPPVGTIVDPLERAWPPGTKRPYYVWVSKFDEELFPWIGASAERRRRFFGIEPLSTTSVNARFVMHYNETAKTQVTPSDAPNTSYDAFYLLAYAAYTLGDAPVTGPSLARAIERLTPPGKPIDVGPAGIFDAYSLLRRGEKIDLNGAFGSLDLDLATGEVPFDHALECVGVDDLGRADRGVESSVVYSSHEDRLTGTMRCP